MSEKRKNIQILAASLFILLLLIGGVIALRSTEHFLPRHVAPAPGLASGRDPKLLATTFPSQSATEPTAAAQSFLGKWSGKWDDTWGVTFTITQNRRSQNLEVLYQWIETPGQPMKRQKLPATLEGNTLHIERGGDNMIDITFSGADPNSATATGHFRNPRTAALTRRQPPG